MPERIGDFLVRTGAISKQQLEEVLNAQKSGDGRSFGAIAIEKGFVGESAIEKFAAAQKTQ